ncbi:hypothetical protein DL769_003606 [Monosporascus sp. CRB-8-3]|nr:hypothetical protein DL769_003606 [Monosporascus sp. CRB-8-3]
MEVEEKLKRSAELRRMVLGTPVSLKAKEAVVGGQMSSELRSKLIHDITRYQGPRSTVQEAAAGAQRQSASPIATAAEFAATLKGNSNSAAQGASDNPSGLDRVTPATNGTSPTKDGMKTDPQPPKRFAKRSNRPERPLIGPSALSKENCRPSTTTAFPKLGPMWPSADATGREPDQVVSDITPLPSDQGTSMMTSVDKSLKRKRNSLSVSSGDSVARPKNSHSSRDRPSPEPSQRQKLLKLAAGHWSKVTRAKPLSATSYKSKSKTPGSRKEGSLDQPAPPSMDKEQTIVEPDAADDAVFREQLSALDSHDSDEYYSDKYYSDEYYSDEDYSKEGDDYDSEGGSDERLSIILGQEVHSDEEVSVNYESTSGVTDGGPYNYTQFKTASGQTVRTAGHRKAKLNDNGDGTLSVVGQQEGDGVKPAIVVSKRPLDPNEPPMAKPAVPTQLKNRYAREQRNSGAFHAQSETPSTTKKTADKQAAPNNPPGESAEELWQYVHQYLKHTPVSPIPQTGHVPQMLTLPRVRDVEFRENPANPYSEARAQDISALIMQVTGQEPPHPCSRCQQGKGPFKGCYVISVEAPQNTRNLVRACANCFYKCNQTYCDLKDWSLQAYPELAGSSEPKQTSTQSPARADPLASKSYPERRSDRIVFKESMAESSSASNKPRAATEGHDEPSINISPNQSMINEPHHQTGRDGHTSVQDDSVPFSKHQTAVANPAQLLELETWEVAPGRIRSKGDLPAENVAFSTTYLSQQGQAVMVAPNIAFQVVIVRPGTTHMWKKDATNKLRLCSVAAGKVKVKMHDEEFTIGPHGMFKVGPGVECTAINMLYLDAVLHISVLPGNLGAD